MMEVSMERFLAAMDGQWRVDSLLRCDDGRTAVVYRSLSDPELKWSHKAFSHSLVPRVGTVGRIGFIQDGQ